MSTSGFLRAPMRALAAIFKGRSQEPDLRAQAEAAAAASAAAYARYAAPAPAAASQADLAATR